MKYGVHIKYNSHVIIETQRTGDSVKVNRKQSSTGAISALQNSAHLHFRLECTEKRVLRMHSKECNKFKSFKCRVFHEASSTFASAIQIRRLAYKLLELKQNCHFLFLLRLFALHFVMLPPCLPRSMVSFLSCLNPSLCFRIFSLDNNILRCNFSKDTRVVLGAVSNGRDAFRNVHFFDSCTCSCCCSCSHPRL